MRNGSVRPKDARSQRLPEAVPGDDVVCQFLERSPDWLAADREALA